MPEPTISAFFALFKDLIPSTFGAVVSLRFVPENMSKRAKAFSVFCAWILGTYSGRAMIAYFNINSPHVCDAVMFGSALFGLSFASNIVKEMGPLLRSISARWGMQTPPPEDEK